MPAIPQRLRRREPLMMLTPNLSMPHAGQVLQAGVMRSRGSHLFYEALEARGVKYAIRILANDSLDGTSANY